eukprot:TRINITY_DN4490_c0_g1_i1.p1 TRINITY_DN4490_c0_g1~~TRINITY_DN4490_c0_g1_i1.p1  ORF type:complete len:619 (+),score=171.53 TRINITY_DN4490_c0_g1_i1:153-2009(+)
MADAVRRNLERLNGDLRPLIEHKYFEEEEVSQILRRVSDYEYKVNRRVPIKEDYLNYIEYLKKLEQLRRLRKKKLGIKKLVRNCDFVISGCVSFVYDRCMMRFPQEIDLWMAYIRELSGHHSIAPNPSKVSAVFANALRFHSTNPKLWISAANWEFRENKNVETARALMQRGIRILKENIEMWISYVRLELEFAARIERRSKMLGIIAPEKAEKEDESKEEGTKEGAPSQESEKGLDATSAMKELVEGKLARIVIQEALTSIPENVDLCIGLLETVREFPSSNGLEELLLETLESTFLHVPSAINAICQTPMRHFQVSGNLDDRESFLRVIDTCADKYLATAEKTKNSIVMESCALFLKHHYDTIFDYLEQDHIRATLVNCFEKTLLIDLLTEGLVLSVVATMPTEGTEVNEILTKALEKLKDSVDLWLLKMDFSLRDAAHNEEFDVGEVSRLATNILESLPSGHPRMGEVYIRWTEVLDIMEVSKDEINRVYHNGLSACKDHDTLRVAYLEWTRRSFGIDAMREEYQMIMDTMSWGVSFLLELIQLEKSNDSTGKELTRLYERALSLCGNENEDLWKEYIEFEEKRGNHKRAVEIQSRASKTLTNGPRTFMESMSME